MSVTDPGEHLSSSINSTLLQTPSLLNPAYLVKTETRSMYRKITGTEFYVTWKAKKRIDCPVLFCFFFSLLPILEPYKAVVPNLFRIRNGFVEETFFVGLGVWWFQDGSSELHLLCSSFLFCGNVRIFHLDFRVRVFKPLRILMSPVI